MYLALCIDWKEQDILALVMSTNQQRVESEADAYRKKYLGHDTYEDTFVEDKTGKFAESLNPWNRRSVFVITPHEQKS